MQDESSRRTLNVKHITINFIFLIIERVRVHDNDMPLSCE